MDLKVEGEGKKGTNGGLAASSDKQRVRMIRNVLVQKEKNDKIFQQGEMFRSFSNKKTLSRYSLGEAMARGNVHIVFKKNF